ncbi:MAG: sulfotransferase domain-containing protein [Psychroflexus sp.]|nr:sulfotransferase domain-containing protein [Psychroflexus sp.]
MKNNKIKKLIIYRLYFITDPILKILPNKKNNSLYIIFSEARSGSTWLAEILRQGLDATLIWEPLHIKRGAVSSKFGYRPYWSNQLKDKLLKVFKGKFLNTWLISKEDKLLPFLKASKPLLVKFIRANKLIPEIFDDLTFKNKPIILLRHPASVFLSQVKRFKKSRENLWWNEKRKRFILKDPRFLKHKKFITKFKDPFYIDFAIFCMNNYHIYNNYKDDRMIPIFYEKMILSPENELAEALKEWNIKYDKINHLIKKPSSEVAKEGLKKKSKDQIAKWKFKLTKEEAEIFQSILDYFSIKVYDMKNGIPKTI